MLLSGNPIKKIVLLGDARVMRPQQGGRTSVLSLSGSKMFLDDAIPKLKTAFSEKGYEVVSAEPAGIGYFWRGPSDYWVYDYDATEKSKKKWRNLSRSPAFEYEYIKQDENLRQAVRKEYERLYDAISLKRARVYEPELANLQGIAASSDADTVCLAHLHGKRYSAGRMAGDMALSALAAMFGGHRKTLTQTKRVAIVCADAGSGQIVYQNSLMRTGDPLGNISKTQVKEAPGRGPKQSEPEEDEFGGISEPYEDDFFAKVLEKLPNANTALASNCRVIDRVRMVIGCVKETGSSGQL